MANWITKYLGFDTKPRDGAIAGIPLDYRDQLYLFVNTVASVTLGLNVTVFNPENGKTRSFQALPGYAFTTTTYAQDTGDPPSTLGLFSDGEVLVAANVVATTGSLPATGQTFCAVFLYRKGVVFGQIIGDFIYVSHAPTWVAGQPTKFCGPMYQPDSIGKLYTFQGTVVNGAGGAGDQSYTVAAPTGGRVEISSLDVFNGDTSNRTVTAQVLDAAGGNVLTSWVNGTINAGVSQSLPLAAAAAATATVAAAGVPIWIAGANVFTVKVAAVALSQDTACGMIMRVWGGAPTITLAGASTPTLTTNTSRFESG